MPFVCRGKKSPKHDRAATLRLVMEVPFVLAAVEDEVPSRTSLGFAIPVDQSKTEGVSEATPDRYVDPEFSSEPNGQRASCIDRISSYWKDKTIVSLEHSGD